MPYTPTREIRRDHRGRLQHLAKCGCGKLAWMYPQHLADSQGCRSCANRRRWDALYGQVIPGKTLRLRWLNRWHQMVRRCTDPRHPRFPDYGGRGIRVHPMFRKFPAFMEHVKTLPGWDDPRPRALALDRINNDQGYAPGNLRLATYSTNRRNQRPPSAPRRPSAS